TPLQTYATPPSSLALNSNEFGTADEVWIIPSSSAEKWDFGGGSNTAIKWSNFRGARAQSRAPDDLEPKDMPGTGGLIAKLPKEQTTVPIPLKHPDVRASILGYISTVDVTQHYENPYSEKIEAIYVFPLPQDAAVSDFVMTIGDRKIRGIIRERAEA